MADTMYAWSRILYGSERNDQGEITGQLAFEVGDEVSQEALGAGDAEWQSLVDGGVVMPYKLPEDLIDIALSPRQIMQNKLTVAQQGYDVTGPTADLIRRFDDEGEVLTQEEQQAAIDAAREAKIAASQAEATSEPTPEPDAPPPAPTTP